MAVTSRWIQIGLLWWIGVLTAAQLAKMAVLAPTLRQAFDLSLPQTGLLISLLEVGGALFGLVAGLLIGRVGARRFLQIGLVLLALTGATEAIASEASLLFAARTVEGIGYVLVVIAAPTMIVAVAAEREQGTALALWSTFVPLGVALGSGVTGIGSTWLGSTGVLLLWAASFAVVLPFTTPLPDASFGRSRGLSLPARAAWLSTGAFGIYTMLVCALTALLPIYLVEQLGAALSPASAVTALASTAALPGCVAMMIIMRRGLPGSRRSLIIMIVSLVASAGPALLIFGEGGTIATSGALAVSTILSGGLVPPLIFARLPQMAGAQSSDDPKLAAAQGLLTQLGAGGALVGPPIGGLVVGLWGWSALGPMITGFTMTMLVVVVAAEWAAAVAIPSAGKPNS